MYDAIDRGEIKALYYVGETRHRTETGLAKVRRVPEKVEFLVMHDILPTESTIYADVVFPGGGGHGGGRDLQQHRTPVQWLNQVVTAAGRIAPQLVDCR